MEERREKILTLAEAADFMRVSKYKLRNAVKGGEIPCFKVGKSIRFRESELMKWIKAEEKLPYPKA